MYCISIIPHLSPHPIRQHSHRQWPVKALYLTQQVPWKQQLRHRQGTAYSQKECPYRQRPVRPEQQFVAENEEKETEDSMCIIH